MASERFFDWVLSLYRRSLRWVLENPGLVLTVLLLTIALNVAIVIKIPKGFFPQQDTGLLGGRDARPAGRFVSRDECGAASRLQNGHQE